MVCRAGWICYHVHFPVLSSCAQKIYQSITLMPTSDMFGLLLFYQFWSMCYSGLMPLTFSIMPVLQSLLVAIHISHFIDSLKYMTMYSPSEDVVSFLIRHWRENGFDGRNDCLFLRARCWWCSFITAVNFRGNATSNTISFITVVCACHWVNRNCHGQVDLEKV